MGEIDSPIGKTSFQSQPMKTWTVGDSSEQDFEVPAGAQPQGPPSAEVYENLTPQQANQLRQEFAARAAAAGGGDGTNVGGGIPGKRRLEILLNIGRGTKDVRLDTNEGPFTFSVRTLKGREQMEVANVAEQLKRVRADSGDYVFTPSGVHQLRSTVMKHALYAIDGVDIDTVLGQSGKPYADRINFREAFINELDEGLLNHLFNAYEKLVVENASRFNLKTDEGLKEAAEEVKKSS